MRIGSAVVKLGGIGLVGTLEKYRRNGYSSAVLRDAVGYMADEGYDLGLLFTSIQPFYARLGWAPFPQTNFEIEVGRRREFESSHWTVREFELKDLPRVIEIYGEHNRARTGTIVRKPRQWSDGYGRQTGMPPTLVAERNGVIGAYANVGLGEGDANNVGDAFLSTYYPNIRELGCAAGSEDALVALCRGVLERAHDAGLEAITGRLPRHDTMTLLLSRESGMPLSFSIHERSMYRVISLSSLLTKIAPELQRRLESAGDTSALRLLFVRCRRPVLRAHRGPRQRPHRGRRPRKHPAGARLIPLLQAALRRLDLQRARRLQSRPGSKPQPQRTLRSSTSSSQRESIPTGYATTSSRTADSHPASGQDAHSVARPKKAAAGEAVYAKLRYVDRVGPAVHDQFGHGHADHGGQLEAVPAEAHGHVEAVDLPGLLQDGVPVRGDREQP